MDLLLRVRGGLQAVVELKLAGLGVERLADLLAAAAKADSVLKRALMLEVAIGPERLAEELDRQITRWCCGAMIEAAVQSGGRRDLARAGLSLAECVVLARAVSDWEGRKDHAAYVANLRNRHARRAVWGIVHRGRTTTYPLVGLRHRPTFRSVRLNDTRLVKVRLARRGRRRAAPCR